MAFRFFIVVLIGGVVACGQDRESTEPDPIRRPVVERLSEQTVRIRWPTRPAWISLRLVAEGM